MKVPSRGVTFVPLHVGHWILAFSLSEIVMISSKGFSHFSHMNSYLGMTTLVAGSAYSPRRTGSVNVNVDPCPTWLLTQIRSAVQLNEFLRQGESQTSVLHLLVCRPHPAELLEYLVVILGGDADTGIGYGHLDQFLVHCRLDVDPTALRGELDSVGEEVQDHLFHLSLIGPNHPHPLCEGRQRVEPCLRMGFVRDLRFEPKSALRRVAEQTV